MSNAKIGLILICILSLAGALYVSLNASNVSSLFNSFISADKSMLESEKILIAVVYLSIWAAFLASWLLRAYKKDNLIANIEKLLYAFAVICIVFICYTNASELITFITKAYAASTASISDSPFGMPSGTTPAADIFLALIRLASRIIPIILALSMLLLANFLAGDHKLYKENQLFI